MDNYNFEKIILDSLAPETGSYWTIKLKNQPARLFHKNNRWSSKKLALKALLWHCQYSTWIETKLFPTPEEIRPIINSLLKRKEIEIIKVV